jgi:hypothetical protein
MFKKQKRINGFLLPGVLPLVRARRLSPVQAGALARNDRMPRRRGVQTGTMVDRMGRAIAEADGGDFDTDPVRYRRLAIAALEPLARPTEAMIDAAHEAVWFDAYWAINSRNDFKKAARAMINAALHEGEGKKPRGTGD